MDTLTTSTPPDAVALPPAAGGDDTDVTGVTTAGRGDDGGMDDEPHVPPPDKCNEQPVARLPEDMLADILGRLRPRWLATSRCVCKAWRDAVDGRGLLRADLLPLSLAGFFVHYDSHKFAELFSRPTPTSTPSSAPAPTGDLTFLCPDDPPLSGFGGTYSDEWTQFMIEGHCNGLLLLRNCVFNPATRRWNPLPPHPLKKVRWSRILYREYLVFDPTVSPHYEVFMIPSSDYTYNPSVVVEASEYPPSPFKIQVFSSRSGSWEERSFVREGDRAMMKQGWADSPSVYRRGALYIQFKHNFVARISISDNTYRLIKPPPDIRGEENHYLELVKSKKGVYLASCENCWLEVWILDESCGQAKWILKHDKDLKPVLAQRRLDQLVSGHWTLENINYKLFLSSQFPEDGDGTKPTTVEDEFEWNSDDDDDNNGDMFEECWWDGSNYYDIESEFRMLGFHPYKETVFLTKMMEVGLAYDLNTSKVKCLGSMYPKRYDWFKSVPNESVEIKCSSPYTPCWVEDFPRKQLS